MKTFNKTPFQINKYIFTENIFLSGFFSLYMFSSIFLFGLGFGGLFIFNLSLEGWSKLSQYLSF